MTVNNTKQANNNDSNNNNNNKIGDQAEAVNHPIISLTRARRYVDSTARMEGGRIEAGGRRRSRERGQLGQVIGNSGGHTHTHTFLHKKNSFANFKHNKNDKMKVGLFH